jgi:hypothetical protein
VVARRFGRIGAARTSGRHLPRRQASQPCDLVRAAIRKLRERNSAFPDYFWFLYMGSEMPAWLEILIDMIGFAGFVGLAIYHKPKKNDEPIR